MTVKPGRIIAHDATQAAIANPSAAAGELAGLAPWCGRHGGLGGVLGWLAGTRAGLERAAWPGVAATPGVGGRPGPRSNPRWLADKILQKKVNPESTCLPRLTLL